MKKRTLALFFAVVMLLTAALPLTALANMEYRYVYTTNGKALNQRSSPISHANNKVASIPYGAKVAVDSFVNDSQWAYVEYNGIWGYVMSRYLVRKQPEDKPVTPSATATPTNPNEYNGFAQTEYNAMVRATAPGGFVNLRWGPSKADAIEARLTDGQELVVIAQNSSWAQVRVSDTNAVGFIMLAFLTDLSYGVSAS